MKKATQDCISDMFRKLLRILRLLLALPLFASGAAHALIISNGSFEANGIEHWESSGVAVQTPTSKTPPNSSVEFLPTDGFRFATMTTTSSIWQDISWDQGDTLFLNFLFYTTEGSNWGKNDYAWMKIGEMAFSLKKKSTIVSHPTDGWEEFSYVFDTKGSGRLQFGVNNAGDGYYASYLYLDNVRGTSLATQAEVPEPGTSLLFGIAIVGLATTTLRRKK